MTRYLLALLLIVPVLIGAQVSPRRNYGADLPPGTVITFAGSICPTGFLSTDGETISRTAYKALYEAIGNAHGNGNGTSTFHKPDYRGKFLRMVDGSAGVDPDKATRTAMNAGGNIGNLIGSIQGDELKAHTHTNYNIATSASTGGNLTLMRSSSSLSDGLANQSAGGNESRPKNAYVMYCIKY